jgi:hypothetical protein
VPVQLSVGKQRVRDRSERGNHVDKVTECAHVQTAVENPRPAGEEGDADTALVWRPFRATEAPLNQSPPSGP